MAGLRTGGLAVVLAVAASAGAGCGTRPPAREAERGAKGPAVPRKPTVVWARSPYCAPANRTAADVDTVAIHTTEGGYDEKKPFAENHRRNYEGTRRYMQKNDREVGAHFLMGPDGEITQLVAERDIAWTTTYYNSRSFGIECSGWAARKETWTPKLLDSLVNVVAYLCVKWEIEPVHPEGDAVRGPLEMTSRGYMGFAGTGIVGHYQVQTSGSEAVKKGKLGIKTDPGKHFPWDDFIQRVQARIAGMKI